jgi:glycerol-3-phosphate dehydrogenase
MRMRQYDVLVVGGGIYGCGVALAAAARGYNTLLVEQNALATGTSSRSSKLIHGGLRYLEQGHVRLVHEALQERRILLDIAPDLVRMHDFFIPLYDDSRYPAWKLAAGLALYRMLARESGGQRLNADEALRQLPGLRAEGLRGAFVYRDAATDDAALVRAVAAGARSQGATVMEHTAFSGAWHSRAGWHVWLAHGQEVKARVIVNAAGPWVNKVQRLISPKPPMIDIDLVQGSHIVLPWSCPGYLYGESEDGRAMFMMPWQGGHTLVGTTETRISGDPGDTCITPEERAALLATWNRYFPDRPAGNQDILYSFSGVRVLPKGEGDFFGRSRETVLLPDHGDKPSLITIYGGKLTTYRREAERVMALIARTLPPPHAADTSTIHLGNGGRS